MTEERSRASVAMDRYADGEEAAFALVYDELAGRLLGFLRRLVRGESDAEDLLQQVFLNMHAARGRFTRGERVEPWAYAIARRLAIDLLRKRRQRFVPFSDELLADGGSASPEAQAHSRGIAAEALAELRALPEAQREAFVLIRVEGLSVADAAAALGVSPGALKVRAHRGAAQIKAALGGADGRGSDDDT